MSDVTKMDTSSSITNFEETHHWHEWKIKKFSTAIIRGKLKSSVFTVRACAEFEWHLQLGTTTSHYSLNLYVNKFNSQREFVIDITLGIIDNNKCFLHCFDETGIVGTLKSAENFISFCDFKNDKEKYLNGDTLMIGCKMTLLKQVNPSSIINEQLFPIPISQLHQDFGQLFNNAEASDITFIVGDKIIYAHKSILMARSSVFAAMFKSPMQEKIKKIINIDDLSADAMEQVLRFIYTDTSDLENETRQLLYAAEKYNLQRLKAMCEKTLFKNISTETASDILIVADRYKAHRLKTNICRFIAFNIKEVVITDGYKELEKKHPELILEVVRAMEYL